MWRFFGGAVVAGLTAAAVAGCGSASTSGHTTPSPAQTTPVAHTVNASATAHVLTRRQLLRRIDRLCAQESATMAPLLRRLYAPGIRPNSAELIDGLMAATRTLEFGLVRLHPSPGERDTFRRYRRSVTRSNTLSEQITAAQGQSTPPKPPAEATLDAAEDSALLEQAYAALLGSHRCTFPPTRLEMHKLATG